SIGTAAVLGAVACANRRGVRVSDYVRVAAFDQTIEDETLRGSLYRDYRERILDDAGFALFVSGNKQTETGIEDANGARREFEIAVERKLIPIPIGATGYVAENIWRKVVDNLTTYYGDERAKPLLQRIGPGSRDIADIIDATMNIIYLYDGR